MSSVISAYHLPILDGLLSHSGQTVQLVRDEDYLIRHFTAPSRLDAEVRSGDYFVTLATALDSLCGRLDEYEARVELEGIISDLIYLQDNYQITKVDKAE